MIIGTFQYDQEADSFHGDIVTPGFDYSAVNITPTDKRMAREPDYRITAPTNRGQVELGAAWKRLSDHGREYVSVMLDGPVLTAPVNAVLFTGDDGKATLLWTRPKTQGRGKGREVAVAGGAGDV